MTVHFDTITPEQRQVISQLGPFTIGRGIYLAGGTAAALLLGHRRSMDLDWFSPDSIPDPLRLADDMRAAAAPINILSVDRGTLHAEISGVRVSVLEYRYDMLQPAVKIAGLECQSASPPDLAAMKLVAISPRGSKKDFIDIYALGQEQLPLAKMLSAYQQKYSIADTGRVLYSLSYFDDADAEPTPEMLWEVEWEQVKQTIRDWIADASR